MQGVLAGGNSNARCLLCALCVTTSPEGPELVDNLLSPLAKAENTQPCSNLDDTHTGQDLDATWWPPGSRGSHNAGSIHASVTLDTAVIWGKNSLYMDNAPRTWLEISPSSTSDL